MVLANGISKAILYKRTLWVIMISQVFGGAGLAAGVTVGALLAQNMLASDRSTGVPSALFTLGSAGAAYLVGRFSQRFGRRIGLTIGFFAGGFGAIGVVLAALWDSIPLLFLSLFIYGAGTATNLQARYAGTDLAHSTQRAKAISMAMVSTTFGAVAGPNLVNVMGQFAESIGVPVLSGPFLLAAAAYLLAGLVLFVFLRPDPYIVAKALADAEEPDRNSLLGENAPLQSSNVRGIFSGAAVMVLSQFVMMAIMTMTPVHMGHHGHELKEVGVVIAFHIGAMFLPSLVTGYLVDKWGRVVMSIAAALTLLASCWIAAIGPADSMAVFIIALSLLGLGWNMGLITGTAILVDSTPPATRAKTQGSVDVWIALSGALGGGLSGVVAAEYSFSTLSLAGSVLSILLIPIVVWTSNRTRDHARNQASR